LYLFYVVFSLSPLFHSNLRFIYLYYIDTYIPCTFFSLCCLLTFSFSAFLSFLWKSRWVFPRTVLSMRLIMCVICFVYTLRGEGECWLVRMYQCLWRLVRVFGFFSERPVCWWAWDTTRQDHYTFSHLKSVSYNTPRGLLGISSTRPGSP
jgi:hypothetical protein